MLTADERTNENYAELRKLLLRNGYSIDDKFADEAGNPSHFWIMIDSFAYRIMYDSSDEEFYRIIFPLGLLDGKKGHAKLFDGINVANSMSKLAKAYIDEDGDLVIVLDALAPTAKIFISNFPRYIAAMKTALSLFNKELEG